MRVIVVGCGRVGSALAYQLYQKGDQVTVIDQDSAAFDNLPADFHGRTIQGDVLVKNVLHRAEIEEADALAAVTSIDSLNSLVAHIARTEYEVLKVVARNYEPRNRPLQEAFGLPVVGAALLGAQHIEELLTDILVRPVYSDKTANFSVYQLVVPDHWHGHSLEELLDRDRNRILAWTRAGQPLAILHMQTLVTGDLIYLSADLEEIEALRSRVDSRQEGSE